MTRISIIIPVYKVEDYLRDCLDSILNQSFTDWECILVDDGSPDKSGTICDEYATRDSRFKVIHKANGGVSSARNVGLNTCKGEYITFIDSDDVVNSNLLSCLYEALDSHAELGLSVCGIKLIFASEMVEKLGRKEGILNVEDNIYVGGEFAEYLSLHLNDDNLRGPYAKLFRKEIIERNNIRFNERLRLGEDVLFTLDYLFHINSLATVNYTGYVYQNAWLSGEKYAPNMNELAESGKLFDVYKKLTSKYDIRCAKWENNHVNYFWRFFYKNVHNSSKPLTYKECLAIFKSIPYLFEIAGRFPKLLRAFISNKMYRVAFVVLYLWKVFYMIKKLNHNQ